MGQAAPLYPHWIESHRAWQGHLELWAPTSVAGTLCLLNRCWTRESENDASQGRTRSW